MSDTKEVVSTQPKTTVPMSAGGNKNALNCPIGPDGKRDWSYGLFECFSSCRLCCFSTWCPCMVVSKNRQHLRSLQNQGTPLPAGSETSEHFCNYCIMEFAGYSYAMQLRDREEMRERYGIHGNAIDDCVITMCCRPCALMQEQREIELEERSFQ